MGELSHTEVTAQGHKASHWETWDSSPGSQASELVQITTGCSAVFLTDTPGFTTDFPTDVEKPPTYK